MKLWFGVAFLVLLIGPGCSIEESLRGSQQWGKGEGELPDRVGSGPDSDWSVPDGSNLITDTDLWEETGYDLPTGEWIFHNGEGKFGYGMTGGTTKPGSEYFFSLIGHDENGDTLDRDVRIQLSDEAFTVLEEETVYVEDIHNNQTIYTGNLPDEKNTSYVLSAEILSNDGNVEDTLIRFIHATEPVVNASLSTNRDRYSSSVEEIELTLHNEGPTQLTIGNHISIEKKVNDEWKVKPNDYLFTMEAMYLNADQKHDQPIDVSSFAPGEYRAIKQMNVDGLDMSVQLAAEFAIES